MGEVWKCYKEEVVWVGWDSKVIVTREGNN
jgi:hypothetical protein